MAPTAAQQPITNQVAERARIAHRKTGVVSRMLIPPSSAGWKNGAGSTSRGGVSSSAYRLRGTFTTLKNPNRYWYSSSSPGIIS